MPGLQRTTAFGVYRHLASADAWPAPAARAWDALAARKSARPRLTMQDAAALPDPLARAVLRFSLQRQAASALVAQAAAEGRPIPQLDDLDDQHVVARAAGESIESSAIDRSWFAAQVAELLLADARQGDVERAARARGGDALARVREARFSFLAPERERLSALVWRARDPSADEGSLRAFEDAAKGFAFGSDALYADPPHVAQAASRLAHLGLRDVYEAVDRDRAKVDITSATQAQRLVDGMKRSGAVALQRAAAEEFARENVKTLPVLYGTAERMRSLGMLDELMFDGLEVLVRTHVLPSLGSLIDVLRDQGGMRDVTVSGKGVSSAPLTVSALERSAKSVDAGFGESRRSGAEHQRDLLRRIERLVEEGRREGRPVLVLGDGRDSALAAHAAARRNPDVRLAYVEFTQSGMNALRDAGPSPLRVVGFAETPLKKLTESTILGEWLVKEEMKLSAEQGLPPPGGKAVVLGHGSVGAGVAEALRAQGFSEIVVVEPDPARAALVGEGVTAVSDAGQAIAGARYVFSCVGEDAVVDGALLAGLPDGCVVVNCASKGEIDTDALAAMERRASGGARAYELEPDLLPEHRTLVVQNEDRRVFVRKRGQPLFDGVRDKDPVLADIYMAGLLCAMCVAADALKRPDFSPGVEAIPARMQDVVLDLVASSYEQRFPAASAAVKARMSDEPAAVDDVDYAGLFRSLPPDARAMVEDQARQWRMRDEALQRIGRLATGRDAPAASPSPEVPFEYVVLVLKDLLARSEPATEG